MSEHDSSPSPSPQPPIPTEEFGVSLDWPEDALADPAADPTHPAGAQPDSGAAEGEGDLDAPAEPGSSSGGSAPDEEAAEEEPAGSGPEAGTSNGADTAWKVGGAWGHQGSLEPLGGDREEERDAGSRAEASAPGTRPQGSSTPWSTALVAPAGLVVRPEGISAALSALAMRIDALVSANSTNRASIAQRLDEHLDLVGRLARTQIADISELQHDNERSLTDVRRAQQGTDDLVRRLIDRFDALRTELGQVRTQLDELGRGQTRLHEVAAAITRLEASIELVPVPEAGTLDEVGGGQDPRAELPFASAGQVDAQQELARQVEALHQALGALSELPDESAEEGSEVLAAMERVEGRLTRLERRGIDSELQETLTRVDQRLDSLAEAAGQAGVGRRGTKEGAGTELDARLDNLERLVTESWQAQRELQRAVGKVLADRPTDAAKDGALAEVRTELVALRRRIAVRAKPEAGALGAGQVEALADAVVDRLRRVLEVVPEEHDANG